MVPVPRDASADLEVVIQLNRLQSGAPARQLQKREGFARYVVARIDEEISFVVIGGEKELVDKRELVFLRPAERVRVDGDAAGTVDRFEIDHRKVAGRRIDGAAIGVLVTIG